MATVTKRLGFVINTQLFANFRWVCVNLSFFQKMELQNLQLNRLLLNCKPLANYFRIRALENFFKTYCLPFFEADVIFVSVLGSGKTEPRKIFCVILKKMSKMSVCAFAVFWKMECWAFLWIVKEKLKRISFQPITRPNCLPYCGLLSALWR